MDLISDALNLRGNINPDFLNESNGTFIDSHSLLAVKEEA